MLARMCKKWTHVCNVQHFSGVSESVGCVSDPGTEINVAVVRVKYRAKICRFLKKR